MSDSMPLMYGRLADWFHLLTPPSDYADEAAEVLELLSEYVDGTLGTALELGSGGGNLASHLAGRLRLTLSDVSTAMLEQSRALNPGLEHIEADMRTLHLGRTFDAVIAHDAIGYLTSEADLEAAMRTAWGHLRPGGAAILMPDWVLDTYVPRSEHGGGDEGSRGLRYLEWDRPLVTGDHVVRTDYVIVTRDGDEVAVHHDVHTLGIFPRATWLRLLRDVGFEPDRVVGRHGYDMFIGVRPVAPGWDPAAAAGRPPGGQRTDEGGGAVLDRGRMAPSSGSGSGAVDSAAGPGNEVAVLTAVPRIDAHQRFWDLDCAERTWQTAPTAALRRSFEPPDLAPELTSNGIDGTILVQPEPSCEETEALLALAEHVSFVQGVVGWLDLTAQDLADRIEDLRARPGGHRLVGLCHSVCDEADADWLGRADVRRGLAAVQAADLAFDLLVRTRELPAAMAVAKALPNLRFVLAHLAHPPIARGDLTAWGRALLAIAELPNVGAKLAGLVTEADWHTWSIDDLRHPVELAIDAFGPGRLMLGSDWPVCLLAGSYNDAIDPVRYLLAELSQHEQADIRGGTALRVYRLGQASADRSASSHSR